MRQKKVSLRLLQKQLEAITLENQQMRNVLFALIKEQGRVRIDKETMDGLSEGDSLDTSESDRHIIITYVASNMLVPNGVTNGKTS